MASSSSDRNPVERLAEEFAARLRRGERPALSEYTARYPQYAAEIEELFPALAVMEQFKPAGGDLTGPSGGATPDDLPPRECLGDYRILREVGRGGMGVVYEAEQQALGRRVALKVLPRKLLADSKHRRRFEREARLAAKLHHTNIVPVFGVGEQDGLPYYVMQFIQGLGLNDVLEELKRLRAGGDSPSAAQLKNAAGNELSAADVARSLLTGPFQPAAADASLEASPVELPARGLQKSLSDSSVVLPGQSGPCGQRKARQPRYWQSVAQIGVQVAEALEYAHQQGVLHRDIKPSNLLLDRQTTVWVTDFGLAKASDSDDLTHTGDVIGTLRYMPPEAFEGHSDVRSDVYSLGLTLYELLAFRPVFDEKDRNRLIKQVTTGDPPRLDRLNPTVPRDLVTIVHKAIDRDPQRRYASAGELAADLQRFTDDEPIKARPASAAERMARWCRRNPVIAVLAAAVILVTAVGFLATLWWLRIALANEREALEQKGIAETARESEAQERYRAEAQTNLARHLLYASDLNVAQEAWETGNLVRARELLDRQRPRGDLEDLRGFEWRYLWRLCRDGSLHTFRGHTQGITRVAFSPNGRMLASASYDGTVRLWDMGARRGMVVLGHEALVNSVAFSPDGKLLATASGDGRVNLWGVASWRRVKVLPQIGPNLVAFTPDSHILASSGKGGCIKLWDIRTGQEAGTFLGPPGSEWVSMALSPDGRTLAAGGNDTNVWLWDLATRKQTDVLRGHSAYVVSLAFSPDGKILASAGNDATLKLWDVGTKQVSSSLHGHSARVSCAAFCPDSKTLVTGYGDGIVKLWDTATKQAVRTLQGHTGRVTAVAFSPAGTALVTGSWDQTLKLWDGAMQGEANLLPGHEAWVHSVAFSPDGKTLASSGWFDRAIKLWNLASGRQVGTLNGHEGSVSSVKFSADGRTLVSASPGDNTVRLWDVASQKQVDLFTHSVGVECAAFSPDGTMLAAGRWNNTVLLWDIATRQERARLSGKLFAFAPDGKVLAIGCPDGTAKLWEIRSQGMVATFEGHPAFQSLGAYGEGETIITAVAFSPDGRTLATAGHDHMVKLWDVATQQQVAALKGHRDIIWSLVFSPDGKTLATCSGDSTVKLWNLKVQAEAATLKGHSGQVASVAFAPDGDLLATAGSDGAIRLWRASPFADTDAPMKSSPPAPEPPHLSAAQDEGFIRDWLILGPIPLADGQTGATAVDEQSIPGEADLQPQAGDKFTVGKKEFVWKRHRASGSFLDFNAFLGRETIYSVAYAVCYIVSDRERKDLELRIGSDDQAKVYLNGREEYTYRGVRLAAVDEDRVPGISLKQGTNVLVFKVVNEGAEWAGCIRFVNERGNPVQGLQVRPSPDTVRSP